ncbi:hypothetical protein NP233_g3514 [Leucocoprinus birnbaumii]|uniref:Uncharacterized protein n=1 Tax=Leucocoprinus birnbaumii TaxID=56174 RepID=A0AAD5VXT1_9AGAR|nr:hypothetical protein NP233_g3514 [Leucocoprinus birnbaumii]
MAPHIMPMVEIPRLAVADNRPGILMFNRAEDIQVNRVHPIQLHRAVLLITALVPHQHLARAASHIYATMALLFLALMAVIKP